MKKFCCRFTLNDNFFMYIHIEAEELTKEKAVMWAMEKKKTIANCLGLDDVYEIKETR